MPWLSALLLVLDPVDIIFRRFGGIISQIQCSDNWSRLWKHFFQDCVPRKAGSHFKDTSIIKASQWIQWYFVTIWRINAQLETLLYISSRHWPHLPSKKPSIGPRGFEVSVLCMNRENSFICLFKIFYFKVAMSLKGSGKCLNHPSFTDGAQLMKPQSNASSWCVCLRECWTPEHAHAMPHVYFRHWAGVLHDMVFN